MFNAIFIGTIGTDNLMQFTKLSTHQSDEISPLEGDRDYSIFKPLSDCSVFLLFIHFLKPFTKITNYDSKVSSKDITIQYISWLPSNYVRDLILCTLGGLLCNAWIEWGGVGVNI